VRKTIPALMAAALALPSQVTPATAGVSDDFHNRAARMTPRPTVTIECGGLNYGCAVDMDCCRPYYCYIPPNNTYGECTE
jgi:hypothetical protein